MIYFQSSMRNARQSSELMQLLVRQVGKRDCHLVFRQPIKVEPYLCLTYEHVTLTNLLKIPIENSITRYYLKLQMFVN